MTSMNRLLEDTGKLEILLREEVSFWQDYIKNHKESTVLDRAIRALNLAEEKLSLYQYMSRSKSSQARQDIRH